MQPDRFRVAVLGPVRVWLPDGTDATPAGVLPRRLLALLVLRRGRTVTSDAAIELLWPDNRPNDPAAALQNHVSRLRRVLVDAIGSVAGGYRLDPAVLDLDVDRLAAALAEPSGHDRLGSMLARWHGSAYPELEELDEARGEALRLDELRTRAREVQARHRIADRNFDGLAAELRALVDDHPLREQPRALLMDVLAATGRHGDALRIYDEFRRLLADELGAEPSAALAARHRQLLAGSDLGEWSPQQRLPIPATSLIGRDALVGDIVDLAANSRLVTLVGTGGVGKTRMLLEVGHRLAEKNPDLPVVLCELARADSATTFDAVAAGLRIDLRPGTPVPERIAGVVGGTDLVLLLDNCEHVVDRAAHLAEHLLARCPRVRIVATSRERLRIAGEQVRPVTPLDATAPESPAVELFVERARAAAGEFAVDDDTLARVAAIVGRLDGLPLAIELAAARMHSHELDEIATGLRERSDFLSTGYRTADRHGSLAAAVAWSYDMLDAPLRRAFTDVAVFAGPFELTAAAAVCDLDRTSMSEHLAQLVERSLVVRYPGRRYALLQTLRTFGRDRLGARTDEVSRRHAQFLVTWVVDANRRLALPGSGAVRQIDEAVGELQRALDWLLDHGDVESAGRIVAALLDYGLLRLRPDVLAWADRVSAADDGDASPVSARVWAAGAYSAWMAGDQPNAGFRAARALAVAGAEVPPHVYGANGVHALFAGRLAESADWYGRAADAAAVTEPGYWPIPAGTQIMVLGYTNNRTVPALAAELVAQVGDEPSPYAAYAWYCAGEALVDADPQQARVYLEKALELAQRSDAAFVTGVAGASKASLDVRLGELAVAAEAYRGLIPHWRRAGMWPTQWVMLRWIAVLLADLQRPADAAVLTGAIRAAQRPAGADAVTLDELADRLREALGDERYAAACRRGASLDDDALLDRALQSL